MDKGKYRMDKNKIDEKTDYSCTEGKRYSTPTLTELGGVNKTTLEGGTEPQEDSGSEFGPS